MLINQNLVYIDLMYNPYQNLLQKIFRIFNSHFDDELIPIYFYLFIYLFIFFFVKPVIQILITQPIVPAVNYHYDKQQ
jgi:hypothetical protein